jgi:capsular exopolysaccharide synthesis family protein
MDEQTRQVQILQVQDEPEEEIHLRDYWSLFMQRWWVIAISFVFVISLTLVYIFITPRQYEAEVVVKLPSSSSGGGLASMLGAFLPMGATSDVATEIELIQGRDIAEKVIKQVQFDKKPKYDNLDWREIIEKFQNRLKVSKRGQTNLISIKINGDSPAEAKDMANAVADVYIQTSENSSKDEWNNLINQMEIKLTEVKNDLEKSRQLLHDYEAKEGINTAFSSLLLGGDLSDAGKSSASQIAQTVVMLKSSIMQMEINLEALRKRYPEAHPDVIDLRNRIAETKQKLNEEESKAIEKYNKQFGLSDLAARVLFNQQLFTQLVSKQEELKAQYIMQNKSPEIAESAVEPMYPVSPKRKLIFVVGAFMGGVMGLGIVLLWEFMNTSIHTPEKARRLLELPVIGNIPKLKVRSKDDWSPLFVYGNSENTNHNSWVRGLYRESYMALRMETLTSLKFNNENHESETKPQRAILITSSVPQEGKSLVSANFAMSLAETGIKVLLVELNQYNSSQNVLLKLDTKMGLMDLLTGKASWDDAINHTPISNLSIITSGVRDNQHELSGLLISEGMNTFMQMARERFDFIVFDSTPITLRSESISIGSRVDGAILVVKADNTKKESVLKSIQIMKDNNINILGTVMNYTKPNKKYSKYFS